MRIALIRLSSLGDIVLCMATIQLIRQLSPDSEISFVTDGRFAPLLEHQPDLEQVVAIDLKGLKKRFSWGGVRSQLQTLNSVAPFDLVIDLHGMIKSAVVGRLLGGRGCGFSRSSRKELLAGVCYRDVFEIPYYLPAVTRYMLLVSKALAIPLSVDELLGYRFHPYIGCSQEDIVFTAGFLSREQRNVLIVPGTSAANKNYPPEAYADVANRLGARVLICHGNDSEYIAAGKIARMVTAATILPPLGIGQLKGLVSQMDLVIGGDTGPTHLAMASGVPSVTLFGATPVCFTPTAINRVIKTPTTPNLLKPDPQDFSVAEIPAVQVATVAAELLSMARKEG